MTNPLPSLTLPDLSQLPGLLSDLSDLSRASGSWLATIGVGLAVGLPMSGAADPVEAQPLPRSFRWLEPNSDRPPAWLGENVYYKKGSGLEYRLHEMKLGETPIEVGVQGPIVRKKKSVGLTVEVRF
jgi:hypothetical protein